MQLTNQSMQAAVALDLYARTYPGMALGTDEYVISADDKPFIQARDRAHPIAPTRPGHPMRVTHDYHRRGPLAYMAAIDVHQARVLGRCDPPPASSRSPDWSTRS